jgi:Sec7-like guanine-nucleotide exchange factor
LFVSFSCSFQLRNYTPQELHTINAEAEVKFNIKPSQARDYLVNKKTIQGLPSEMAQFIFEHNQQLSKRRIGEYIGRFDLYNQQVCDSLMHKYDFANLSLDTAIRDLMKRFRLPGESQQIDRILEKFAKSYYNQNPSIFSSQDLVHILAFSIMMLNTDLHNQSIAQTKKMTLQEFIRNNRGINRGQDLPKEMLEAIYNRVKENEIRMNENDQYESDNVTFMNPVKCGWVKKKSDTFIPQFWESKKPDGTSKIWPLLRD